MIVSQEHNPFIIDVSQNSINTTSILSQEFIEVNISLSFKGETQIINTVINGELPNPVILEVIAFKERVLNNGGVFEGEEQLIEYLTELNEI